MKDYRFSFAETGPSSEHKKTFASPPIYTQPRRFCWGFDKRDQRRMIRWGEDTSEAEKEHAIRNLSGELLDSTDNHTSWKGNVQENVGQRKSATEDSNTGLKCTTDFVWDQSAETVGNKYVGKDSSLKSRRKSWADIVEEEELGTDLGQSFHSWNYEDACSDENLNVNTFNHNSYQKNQLGSTCQKLEAADLQDGYATSMNAVSSRNSTARRSLSYESAEDVNTKRKNRLQVFRDITPTPDSP
ncbi:PROTEIN POLLENLESS 3-LIKE 2 [Salix koriyanagi]|uniref:PROTEIN POLLENLESS 3-LIKE 2 n=1 Tax=Salix koriyanagi TaxID=2511006 RepID=A0A9Q0X3Q8_9ROSI|nr:PROTEIN POLLENLESS 3-LIKE 2 [Salix koriyanagi]